MISLCVELHHGSVPKHIRQEADMACEWVAEYVPKNFLLPVILINASVIDIGGGDCFGGFWYEEDSKKPEIGIIYIAASPAGMSEESERMTFLATFFHEFAHFEQLRDGRKVQERGVEVRARNLLRQYEEDRDG